MNAAGENELNQALSKFAGRLARWSGDDVDADEDVQPVGIDLVYFASRLICLFGMTR